MRLVLFCLAVLSSDCAVVHVAGADVTLECPAQFADNKDNAITCTVNKTAIEGVTCAVPQTSLGFSLTRRTELSSSPIGVAPYPCTSPAPVTATGTCGCTKQEGAILTYTLLFKANMTTDEGGKVTCQICDVSVPDLLRSSSDSCKHITDVISTTIVAPADSTTDGDADSTSAGDADTTTDGDARDEKGSSPSYVRLIIGATAGGVVVVAMAISTALWCYKKRSSSDYNVQSNTRSNAPPPAVGTARPFADRGVAATLDVKPIEEGAGENASEASEASDVSETSEEP